LTILASPRASHLRELVLHEQVDPLVGPLDHEVLWGA